MKQTISMSIKETERIAIMNNLISKRIKQKHASSQLGISIRQAQRMVKPYKLTGASDLVHKSRGKLGNRLMQPKKKNQIISFIKQKYADFGPTFAAEKLLEWDGISVSKETVRCKRST